MNQYAEDLKHQIEIDKEKKLKAYEMTEKEKQINMGGLTAYREGSYDPGTRVVPGLHKNQNSSLNKYLRSTLSRATNRMSPMQKSMDPNAMKRILDNNNISIPPKRDLSNDYDGAEPKIKKFPTTT